MLINKVFDLAQVIIGNNHFELLVFNMFMHLNIHFKFYFYCDYSYPHMTMYCAVVSSRFMAGFALKSDKRNTHM